MIEFQWQTMSESEWISLRHAAEILGVHPATVRNWADNGDLPSRRTPGGHRRFRKADLLQHAKTQGELQPLEAQFIIQNALGHTRLHVGGGNLTLMPWYERISETARAQLRQEGMHTLEAIRKYLAAGAPDEQLSAAITAGTHYARILSESGLRLADAVRGFYYFSDFVINSILTWSEITPPRNAMADWGTLLRQVNTFSNTILLSIIEYYESE
ncbi:MAG: helix-turn-helix domain-containing protein [Anaerolineae bacterium]|nr:helix-turn-helix domain-containing protein [Anaerolineae bacterium]